MNFENENVLFVKTLFFSIMKNKSIMTMSKFLIVFLMRVLSTIHSNDQNRNDSNFSKKKIDQMRSIKKSKFDKKKVVCKFRQFCIE